jgi:ribosomal protein S18 acetylase RimI-like enzyme
MYDLRWRVLKKPLNQPKGSERDEKDCRENGVHNFIALIDDDIVGTARFHTCNEHEGQIRYLAVEKKYRRQNVAKCLLKHIERYSISLGIQYIKLNARKKIQTLFEKLNYEPLGEGPKLYDEINSTVMGKPIIKIP